MQLLGFNHNSIIVKEDNIFKEIKISIKDLGENGWDSYYSRNETIVVDVIETSEEPDYDFVFFKKLMPEDEKKLKTLLSYKEGDFISMNIFGGRISYSYDTYEQNNAYLDLDFWDVGINKNYTEDAKIVEDVDKAFFSTDWYESLEKLLEVYDFNSPIHISKECDYKEEFLKIYNKIVNS